MVINNYRCLWLTIDDYYWLSINGPTRRQENAMFHFRYAVWATTKMSKNFALMCSRRLRVICRVLQGKAVETFAIEWCTTQNHFWSLVAKQFTNWTVQNGDTASKKTKRQSVFRFQTFVHHISVTMLKIGHSLNEITQLMARILSENIQRGAVSSFGPSIMGAFFEMPERKYTFFTSLSKNYVSISFLVSRLLMSTLYATKWAKISMPKKWALGSFDLQSLKLKLIMSAHSFMTTSLSTQL